MNILLIGPRATGKTTLGRLLAQRSGRLFVDLDERVRTHFGGLGVREIWSRHGEAAWRRVEAACLLEAAGESDRVIALGGGTPMIPEASQTIVAAQRSDRARVIYLQCEITELIRRLRQEAGDRPRLSGEDVALETKRILAEREQTYIELADAIVRTDHRDEGNVVARLLEVSEEW
jgi:shikimate kinase